MLPGRVAGDAADPVELALPRSGLAPGLHEVAVLGELRDAVVGAEPVGDVDVAGAVPGDVRRPVEVVAVDAGAGSAAAAPAAAAAAAPGFRRRVAAGRVRPPLAGTPGPGRTRDVLRLSAEHHQEPAVGIELHDLVRSGVDDPDVVLRIDAHLLREVDARRRPGRSPSRTCRSDRTETGASRRDRRSARRRAWRPRGRCARRRRRGPSSWSPRRRLRRVATAGSVRKSAFAS